MTTFLSLSNELINSAVDYLLKKELAHLPQAARAINEVLSPPLSSKT